MNMVLTQNGVQQDIEEILGLRDMSEAEQQLFLERVGALVIESATLKYMVGLIPEHRQDFTQWLEEHESDDSLLEHALEVYPEFAEVLTEEMNAFQSETVKLFGGVA